MHPNGEGFEDKEFKHWSIWILMISVISNVRGDGANASFLTGLCAIEYRLISSISNSIDRVNNDCSQHYFSVSRPRFVNYFQTTIKR